MPHLDAAALSLDTSGLDFLGKVLETATDFAIPQSAFEVPAPRSRLSDAMAQGEVNRPLRLDAMAEPA